MQAGLGAMAAESCRKRLQDEGTCSVCLDYFRDPVSLDCGHSFCRACIAQSWGDAPSEAPCPQCRVKVQTKRLRANRQLASVAEIAKMLSDLSCPEPGGRPQPMKIPLKDDESSVCVMRGGSQEYRVLPVAEAAQGFKNRTSRVLRMEREDILLHKAENEKQTQDLLEQMELEREKTSCAFRELRLFLEEKEELLLAQMQKVEKEIVRRRDENMARLSGKLTFLDSLIQEMEEKNQEPVSEFVLNLMNILVRVDKEKTKNPVAFPAALKWRVQDFSDIHPFLEAIMKPFQDTLISGLQLQEANVTLDPETAHPKLILSEDRKSVTWEKEQQDWPDNPERFDSWPIVLGCEKFTSGRYFWEIAVGSEEQWAVGVAQKSVRRKGKIEFTPEEGIWAVGKWGGKYRITSHLRYPPLALTQDLKRIRVTLNCPGGQVAFFDADSGAHLHTYSGASRDVLLPFFYVTGKAHLKLSRASQ